MEHEKKMGSYSNGSSYDIRKSHNFYDASLCRRT